MSASKRSQRVYDGTRYWTGNIMLRKTDAVIATHSCASSGPSGCMARKPGMTRSTIAALASLAAIRGSESYVAVSGGGQGCATSHDSGTRVAGSCASRSYRIVVPVRPCPTITMGGRMSPVAIPGRARRSATMPSRLTSCAVISVSTIVRPRSLSAASVARLSSRRVNPSRHDGSPKSSRPVCAHACSASRDS